MPWPIKNCLGSDALLARERSAGMQTTAHYQSSQARAERIKDDVVTFLIEAKRAGKPVMAYGAGAKGNTLTNYAGVRVDLLAEVAVQLKYVKEWGASWWWRCLHCGSSSCDRGGAHDAGPIPFK